MILITGASGRLGSYLVPMFREESRYVWAPSHDGLDITTVTKGMIDYINEGYSTVINLAAYVDVIGAESDPMRALHTNAWSLKWLTELDFSVDIYHISTDYVYSGDSPSSLETDLLKPFNNYGYSKAVGDTLLLTNNKGNIRILRTSFKANPFPHENAFTDVITNADRVDVIAKLLKNFIDLRPPSGVYNIGTKPKSIYDLARLTKPNVNKITLSDLNLSFLRPDLTMNLSKYHSLI